jgi:outer membrane usher protein
VLVNGAVMQRLNLRPGNYNLRDPPLAAGANDVELAITTEDGERRTERFNAYSDMSLLAAGKSEWAVGAGMPSYLIDSGRVYETGLTMATSYLRYGLTDDITGGLHLQGDDDLVMGGGGFDFGTPWGLFGIDTGVSSGDPGTGVAVDLKWSLVNFGAFAAGRNEALFASAEYRSTDFHRPGEVLGAADGILYPEFNYWLRVSGSYSMPLIEDVTATLSARYQFADDERKALGGYLVQGDRYGIDLTLSRALSETASGSLTVGYSNELYGLDDDLNYATDPEFRVALRLTMRPDERTSVYGGFDTLGRDSMLSAQRAEGNGAGRWDTSVDVSTRGRDEHATAGVSAGYYGDRAEVRVSHTADADGFDAASPSFDGARQRTSLRIGTAIAFAGDRIAVGAPVRGEAFAIVAPHESLAGHDIVTGSIDNVRARANALGNGLITDLPAYSPSSVAVDVEDLPLGYSLGAGAFDTFAPYRGGYVFEVGSAYSVSVLGTLVDARGEPLSLVAGTARPQGGQGNPVAVFTNGAGRFGAEGLSPGRWIVEMPLDGGPAIYTIDIPQGANGLVKIGTLGPSQGSAQ